jgi:phage tail-like protein
MSNTETDWSEVNDLISQLVGNQMNAAGEPRPLTDDEKQRIADIVKALEPAAQDLETSALLGEIEAAEVAELEARGADLSDWEQVDGELDTMAELAELSDGPATPVQSKAIGSIGILDRLSVLKPIHPNYLFHVIIGTNPIGSFSAISGVELTHTPFEYFEGGRNKSPHLMMDKVNTGQVTLKSGTMWMNPFGGWFDTLQMGVKNRKTVTILHLDRERMPIRIYTLSRCFPIKWVAAPLDAAASQVTLDELTLRFESITTIAVPVTNMSF